MTILDAKLSGKILKNNNIHSDFPIFLADLKNRMRHVYRNQTEHDPFLNKRGITSVVLTEIMSCNPLAVSIPEVYGGRGGDITEILAVLSSASYESLAFALTLGINSALFIQPVAKYADEDVKKAVFSRFIHEGSMGGLMITEPDYGSNALHMQTFYTKEDGNFHLQGTKHWAGLTGFARHWLLTARERAGSGDLKRDIEFFVCDTHCDDQKIVVDEYFDNLGFHQIPYGRNLIDVRIPVTHRLKPETTGINLLLDLLHRSRLQFPGMGLGFIQRMMDEAISHCKKRFVGGKSLFHYDQVQQRLARMQSSFTITSAMCAFSSDKAGIEHDLVSFSIAANSLKTLVTDMMQEAAQSLVQLVGAKAYRFSNIGARGIIDSRPFQIFEGSNDILYTQITESLLKLMKKTREFNLSRFLAGFHLTEKASGRIRDLLNFDLTIHLPQRKLVEMGQVISRVLAMEMVIDLEIKGFRKDLISNCLALLRKDIACMAGSFQHAENTLVVEEYLPDSSWY